MRKPKPPSNEAQRLERLHSYNILDTLPEQTYDDIVALAAHICEVPIALVSLVDEHRQWFKARYGLDAAETPRAVSFCGHVVETAQELVVADSHADERFADNPLATDYPHVRFYAGTPLRTKDDLVLGTLCVIDHVPRSLTEQQRTMLKSLSNLVMSQLELRMQLDHSEALQQQLIAAKEVAEQADKSKSQFLATMSHELRTPLNAIIGFSKILCKNKRNTLGPLDLKYLGRIYDNGTHLLRLINEVLDISKIEAGRMSYREDACEIDEIVHTVMHLQDSLAQENSIALSAEVPKRLLPFIADSHRLRQVLTNLVSNAIKFTERGTVTVRVVARDDTRQVAAIDVIDTGVGIAADKLEAIFRPFEQADGTTTRAYAGTGLGLPISRGFCQGMGMSLEVDSEVGRGSTFRIVIPAELSEQSILTSRRASGKDGVSGDDATDAASGGQRAGPARAPGRAPDLTKDLAPDLVSSTSPKRLVLVVDDNADARQLLAAQLRELGCEVRLAQNGEECLRLARALRPDLITLDLMMPHINGWQVLAHLRKDSVLRRIPVVVISMIADEGRMTLCGTLDVLNKPVRQQDLSSIVDRLGGHQRRALIVEDNPDARMVLAEYLESTHWQIAEATNGREGFDALSRFQPDVVFLDLMMPVMDGAQFLDRVRSAPEHRDLPIVVVTAKELSDSERSNLLSKANSVLAKGDQLQNQLRGVLQRI